MYYRWTEKAKDLDKIKKLEQKTGKWYRSKWSIIKYSIPEYYHLVRTGYIEEKAESNSAAQVHQRKLFILEGHIRAMEINVARLNKEIDEVFPKLKNELNLRYSMKWKLALDEIEKSKQKPEPT